jgi:hypothetical protein
VLTLDCASAEDVHVVIVSPLDGAVVKPGTNVPISYKVSSWIDSQPMKGACLEAWLTGEDENENLQPAKTCVQGIEQFAMTPHEEGTYDLRVTVWASNGIDVAHFETKPHSVTISNTAFLDGAGYERKEGFRMVRKLPKLLKLL